MKFLAWVAVLLVSVAAVRDTEWESFKHKFGKSYKSVAEEVYRKRIFKENLALIARHNALHKQGKVTFTLGVNQFGDLTNEEFATKINGYRQNKTKKAAELFQLSKGASAPPSIDWRDHGIVTRVKDEGNCLCSWAFSAIGSVEGQHAITTGNLVSLSEQQLLNCRYDYILGCSSVSIQDAFQIIIANKGIDSEALYPFTGCGGICHYHVGKRLATISSYADVRALDESALQDAVGTIGPVSVAIDASRVSFQLYSNGVYYEPNCSELILDHGVLVVGYGAEGGQDYWLVKNSWGTSWGEQGYIKMARNRNNNCGIATDASYPIP